MLQEGIRGQTHWNHTHRKLANLITQTTALSNSMKLSQAMWGHPRWTGWISLQSKQLSRIFSNTTIQKHQFFSTQPSSQSNSHILTWPHWNHNHRKLANLITWNTALFNSVKLSHAVWGNPRCMGHGGEVWQNVVHWRREWQTVSVFLPWEPHEQYEKAK